MRSASLALACCFLVPLAAAARDADVEPQMHIAAESRQSAPKFAALTPGSQEPAIRLDDATPASALPRTGITVALTFDACMGAVDDRILAVLVDQAIPATIFVTHRWLKRNPAALATLLAHPELFEIENHGDQHVPAVTDHPTIFGLKSAGTIEAVRSEVLGGGAAIVAATGRTPHWFRGATARYSHDAVAEIAADGYLLAGYSLNADMGASLPAAAVEHRIRAAKNGDVVIAHINQPKRSSGAGVAAGIMALHAGGAHFVRLDDATIEAMR